MTRRATFPSLEVDAVSGKAYETAESLLTAYHYQDERESHLLRGDVAMARDAGERALERMADTYENEFPEADRGRARRAGEGFMRALFCQDEIENWDLILKAPNQDAIEDVLLSDIDGKYGTNASRDPRWGAVREHLRDACGLVGIDEAYADKQSRFWLLHGQIKQYWERVAIEAHGIKLAAMVGETTPEISRLLGEYFVEGVKRHDDWSHRDIDDDIDDVLEPVATYYQKVFDLQRKK